MKVARDYFSWSQLSLWLSSKKSFYKKYCLEEKSFSNIYFEKGKELGEYKETGHIPGYVKNPHMLEVVGDAVPELEIMEHKVEVKIGDINLLAYIDSGMGNFSDFLEYKTGKEKWTQQRVDNHEQLDFYALCYYIASGEKTIPTCNLIWIETIELEHEGNKVIEYTGLVESFERVFTMDDIVRIMAKVISVRNEIDEWQYEEIEIPENKSKRFLELSKLLSKTKEELDLLKLEILTSMEAQKVKYAKSSEGSFSISARKSWSYSKSLTDKKQKYKDEITKEEKIQQKDGTAKFSESTSLKFTKSKK